MTSTADELESVRIQMLKKRLEAARAEARQAYLDGMQDALCPFYYEVEGYDHRRQTHSTAEACKLGGDAFACFGDPEHCTVLEMKAEEKRRAIEEDRRCRLSDNWQNHVSLGE